jgi:hypothetical protein
MMIPLLMTFLLVSGADGTDRLIAYHVQHYPKLEVQDVYKLLYQGEFGIGHLLGDGSHARDYLREEIAGLDTVSIVEDLLEPVSSDGGMVRVNLRPFKKLQHAQELLVQAMLETAARTHGDTARFLDTWRTFVEFATHSTFNQQEVRAWDARIRGGDLRVTHHSDVYESAYHPAYRVCRRTIIEALLAADQGTRH